MRIGFYELVVFTNRRWARDGAVRCESEKWAQKKSACKERIGSFESCGNANAVRAEASRNRVGQEVESLCSPGFFFHMVQGRGVRPSSSLSYGENRWFESSPCNQKKSDAKIVG